jgi:hypothetical protein
MATILDATLTRRAADPAVTPLRRATDPAPERSDLAEYEFSVGKGSRSYSLSTTGHEHFPGSGLDLERSTVTCPTCWEAQRFAGVDMQHITMELPADLWLLTRQSAGARGKTVAKFAQEALVEGLAALGLQTPSAPTQRSKR